MHFNNVLLVLGVAEGINAWGLLNPFGFKPLPLAQSVKPMQCADVKWTNPLVISSCSAACCSRPLMKYATEQIHRACSLEFLLSELGLLHQEVAPKLLVSRLKFMALKVLTVPSVSSMPFFMR